MSSPIPAARAASSDHSATLARLRVLDGFRAGLDDERDDALDDDGTIDLAAMLALDEACEGDERRQAVDDRPAMAGSPASPSSPAPAPASRSAKTLFMQRLLENIQPLLRLDNEEFEAFLLQSRMYPSLSRFAMSGVEFFVPRRDITVGLAMKTLRERIERAAIIAELVCRLRRDDDEEDAPGNDDEAVVASAAIRDDLREALGMLGVYEQAIRGGEAVVQYREPVFCEAG